MSITIELDPQLTEKLTRQAADQNVSIEEWAVRLLQEAATNGSSTSWRRLNERRLDLIAKEYSESLSHAEQTELNALQESAAKTCEPQDKMLLERLKSLQALANEIVGDKNE